MCKINIDMLFISRYRPTIFFQIYFRRLVLVAIGDSAGNRMSDAAYNALIKFGARNQLKYKFRNSYALLGWSGPGVLDAVSQVIVLMLK